MGGADHPPHGGCHPAGNGSPGMAPDTHSSILDQMVHEIPVSMLDAFPDAHIGITPQGWMRQWDDQGKVTSGDWPEAGSILPKADAVDHQYRRCQPR